MTKIVTVSLPDIGEGVMEGEVIEWLKQPNDSLKQDEPVVVVMTDKATVELPAPYPGKLVKQYCKAGQIAIKDKPLYDIDVAEEATGQPVEQITLTEQKNLPDPIKEEAKQPEEEKVLAAPPVRQLARELKLNINQVKGTGKEGRVTKEDLLNYQKSSKDGSKKEIKTQADQEIPLIGIRNLMAKRMVESKRNIPHFSYFEQVDATRLVKLRHSFKEEAAKQGISVTYMPFIIKAMSVCLTQYPIVNSSIDTEKNAIVIHKHQNIGIAVTTHNGLIVPVLKDVQNMTLQQLIMNYEELKNRALAGKLAASDMKDSTISISNFGVIAGGGLWATPIINYPEVAILAIARIQKQPIVRNEKVVVRDVLNLSWSFDHRVIDGDLAATFSHHLSTLLQNPAALL
jgi:pyruvate dehydrogenase E2 component (dihydrolipoamide acetyltransferase)